MTCLNKENTKKSLILNREILLNSTLTLSLRKDQFKHLPFKMTLTKTHVLSILRRNQCQFKFNSGALLTWKDLVLSPIYHMTDFGAKNLEKVRNENN